MNWEDFQAQVSQSYREGLLTSEQATQLLLEGKNAFEAGVALPDVPRSALSALEPAGPQWPSQQAGLPALAASNRQSALPDLAGMLLDFSHNMGKDFVGAFKPLTLPEQQGESAAGYMSRQADEFGKSRQGAFNRDNDESLLGNFGGLTGGLATYPMQALSSLGSLLASPFTTKDQELRDLEIKAEQAQLADQAQQTADAAQSAGQQAAKAAPPGLPTLGLPSYGLERQADAISGAYSGLADAYKDISSGLTPPPQLDQADFDRANFLNILNRGTMTPAWGELAQYQLQSDFESRQADLTLGAAQAEAEGDLARAKLFGEAGSRAARMEIKLRSDRKAYVDGPAGDYWFNMNRGNVEDANAALLESIRQTDETAWATTIAMEIGLGAEAGASYQDLKTEVLSSDEGRQAARQLGYDLSKLQTEDSKFASFMNELAAARTSNEFQTGLFEALPGLREALKVGETEGYRQFLSLDTLAEAEAISAFSEGGAQNSQSRSSTKVAETTGDWLEYANQNAVRNQPLSEDLVAAANKVIPQLGLTMRVTSGGQPSSGRFRVGSARHDNGRAADVELYKDGRLLDMRREEDQKLLGEVVSGLKAAGLTGFGAGVDYMGPHRIHIGYGVPVVWGARGKSANAPQWLFDAYYNGTS